MDGLLFVVKILDLHGCYMNKIHACFVLAVMCNIASESGEVCDVRLLWGRAFPCVCQAAVVEVVMNFVSWSVILLFKIVILKYKCYFCKDNIVKLMNCVAQRLGVIWICAFGVDVGIGVFVKNGVSLPCWCCVLWMWLEVLMRKISDSSCGY